MTRTYENTGGQGGQGGSGGHGAGGDSGVSVASSTSSSSVAGTATASSGSGMCMAAEDCFNGVDDNCDGLTDCEDPACNGVAVCAPQLDGVPSGVVVAGTDACPIGYTAGEQIIHRSLVDGGCTGCTCNVKGTTCTGDVWYYATSAACTGDLGGVGGTLGGNYGLACDSNKPISSGQTYGMRTSAWNVQQSCTAGGLAKVAPAAWGETVKFCAADKEGKGCSAGSVCVPQVAKAPHCALTAGSAKCAGFATSESDWYTDFKDNRTCGACGCTATGGSCSPLTLAVGSDYTCGSNAVVGEKTKMCFSGSGIYAPPVHLAGIPKVGTCTGDAPTTGSLVATGQSTLCCQP